MSEITLLVIDVQIGMFEEPEGPFHNADATLKNISRLIEGARSSDVDVIFVQHCEEAGTFVPGTRLFGIHPDVTPLDNEPVVQKRTPDSFHETDLKETLDVLGTKRLVVCGMQTEVCVNATSQRAFDFGYDVTLAADAHGTWDDEDTSAEDIIVRYNEDLGNAFATVTRTEEIDFQKMKGNP